MNSIILLLVPIAFGQQGPVPLSDESKKTAILDKIDAGFAAQAERTKQAALAQEAFKNQDWSNFLIYRAKVAAEDGKMNDAFNEAIRLTLEAHKIAPHASGTVANGPMKGSAPAFMPRYQENPVFVRKVTKAEGTADGADHYFGVEFTGRRHAATLPDGTVHVVHQAFVEAAQFRRIAPIAGLLYHESVHFGDLVSIGWKTQEDAELRAYTLEAKNSRTLGLNFNEGTYLVGKKIDLQAAIKADKATPAFPTPDDELIAQRAFEKGQAELEALREQERHATAMIAASQEKQKQLLVEREARLKKDAEDKQAALGYGKPTAEQLVSEGTKCGFRTFVLGLGENPKIGSFRDEKASDFTNDEYTDLGGMKMSLLVARVCINGGTVTAPCNDALPIMNERWNERGFINRRFFTGGAGRTIEPWSWNECIDEVLTKLKTPIELQAMNKIAKSYRADWKDYWKERARREKPSRVDPPAQESRGDSQQGGSDKVGGHDFSKPQQTIDKYKR